MKSEDLKVYKPLNKEELKVAKKEILKHISENMLQFGFKLYGQKLIRKSNDLFHIIYLDMRGSWMGASSSLKTEIAIVSIYDTDIFIKNYELTSKQYIEDIIPGIRNYYQITKEYELFADYIFRNLMSNVIPYFEKFKSSKDIILKKSIFKTEKSIEILKRNPNLILYAEMSNQVNKLSQQIINDKIKLAENLNSDEENINELKLIKVNIETSQWEKISEILKEKNEKIIEKLKLKKAYC